MIRGTLAALTLLANAVFAGDLTLVTLDPGHFHAALFQREMLPGIAEESFVYAPLGPDLTAHLNRVAQFNLRKDSPTRWRLRVYTGPDFQERMLRERPGQIVVMSGRNRGKMDRILGAWRPDCMCSRTNRGSSSRKTCPSSRPRWTLPMPSTSLPTTP